MIKLLLIVTYGSQKLSISLLSGQELGNHLLNVSIASRSPDLLERFLKITELFHLTFHLLFEEFAPQLLDTKVCSELNLISILVFIFSRFGDFWLSFYSVHSLLESLFLVLNTKLERKDSLLALFDLMLNVLHQIIESIFGLELILFGHSLFVWLFLEDLLFTSERFSEVVWCKLEGDKVLFHTFEHMLILILMQLLKVMRLFDFFLLFVCFICFFFGSTCVLFNLSFLFTDFLDSFLLIVKKARLSLLLWVILLTFIRIKSCSFCATSLWISSYFFLSFFKANETSFFSSSPASYTIYQIND